MNSKLLAERQVLIVEDEMLVAMQIEDMLFDLGCSAVTVIATVEAAVNCIAANKFDLAMLDLNLIGSKTYLVADALRERRIPFAFSTGYGVHGVDDVYRDQPILAKPYSLCQLEEVIAKILADCA